MDILNDDCLVNIFNNVPELRNQVQISRVCKRFEAIIRRMWRSQKCYQTLNLSEWFGWLPEIQDLTYFLHSVRTSLTSIVIGDETLNKFLLNIKQILKAKEICAPISSTVCLPSVQHFEGEEKSFYSMITDSDMKILVRTVPNLLSLHLREPLSGRYVCDFLMLEELYLYVPSNNVLEIENTHFEAICIRLKYLRILDVRRYDGKSHLDLTPVLNCENLAVLKVNLHPLKKCLPQVLLMPKLVSLNVMLDSEIDVGSILNVDTHDFKIYETVEFHDVLKNQGERIIGLAVDLYYFPLDSAWASNLNLWQGGRKLKKFCLCSCELSPDPLLNLANIMNCLEYLSLRNWQHLTNDHVLHFVERCVHLEHLDVSYCPNIDGKLLYQIMDVLKKQDRNHALHIYYMMSGLEDEVQKMNPKIWQAQGLVDLSMDFPAGSEKGLSYVYRGYEFDFVCNDMS
ncbi:PREDICTED: uncharacterized protein LOC108366981 isoform X1 [Rhagoletis zephyria]|uniref:uncharacterized protein LOC108366981 isoform X1 n=1 Tax=Rhagoletis zephyria TaxID=28612 RepID=UPI0008113C41|nr:PREDICTED: uncharacterized protein LOC108366981 isoform X1 [Rhagoletis zephyria]XP_017476977.1 PREDICTED: uncharacterized protein LOC108366981 isoform X1 [Rhagoletis zephyria]